MAQLCKHCATPYTEDSGIGDFCCAGCEQVYLLIQHEGLGDYYRWQDRVSQPVKDRTLADLDSVALRRAQSEVESGSDSGEAVFEVEGMSCMGCAWLVERLAANQSGLIEATASLSRHALTLRWSGAAFDLSSLGSELFKFGYRIRSTPRDPSSAPRLSPLALRFLLTLVFTGNALLLAAFEQFVVHSGERITLVSLLSLICLCFTLLLGAAPFFLSAYRVFKIRRFHSDWIPVTLILGSTLYIGFGVSFSLSAGTFLIASLVCVLIGARWLGALFSKR